LNLAKLYQVKTGGQLTPDDCYKINKSLSSVDVRDIPPEQIENVSCYLASALYANSVDPKHIEALDLLLRELQKRT
jgi:hypothetical protein